MHSLLIIDDNPTLERALRRDYQDTEIDVLSAKSAAEGVRLAAQWAPDLILLDISLPDQSGLSTLEEIQKIGPSIPVVVMIAAGTSDVAIEAIKRGAFEYLPKPPPLPRVRELVAEALSIRRLAHVPSRGAEEKPPRTANSDGLIGRCPAMQQVYKAIGRVASQNVNVLIRGESGTGKELVAHAIYRHSARSGGRFLAVNCAAIPETLLESELFGHEKGSFTGAHNKRVGKFEQCSGGTLFLDEVGDMTPLMQSKVLRVLEEKQFERVGGNETVETDVRIIAATNRNLEQMLTAGQFRPDLYYRLDGFGITLPPLRERADDMVELVEYFLACFSRELGKNVYEIPPETMDLLLRHPWPGNIRELQSVLRQSLLYATSPILLPEFLPTSLSPGTSRPGFAPTPRDPGAPWLDHFVEERLAAGTEQLYAESLALMERLVLTRVLRHADGNQSRAAKILGITRGSLRSKIRAQGIAINQNVHVADPLPTDLTFSMPSCSQPG